MPTHSPDNLPADWDDSVTPTLFSMLAPTARIRAAIEQMPEEMLTLNERQIEKLIRNDHEGKFPRMLGLMKLQFWDEFKNAQREKRPMVMENVYYGICHRLWFYKHVVESPHNLAWLLCPPTDEMLIHRDLLNRAMARLSDAMDADLYDESRVTYIGQDGKKHSKKVRKLNVALLREIHAITKTLQDRIHGGIIQRQQILQKNINVNVPLGERTPGSGVGGLTLDSPDLTLDQLEAFSQKLSGVMLKLEAMPQATVIENEAANAPASEDVLSAGDTKL